MYRYFLLLGIIGLFSPFISAQNEAYHLGDFQLPDINYHGLNLDARANGDIRDNPSIPNLDGNTDSRFSSRVLLSYFHYKSNSKIQSSEWASLNAQPYNYRSTAQQTIRNSHVNLYYNKTAQHYISPSRFRGYGIDANTGFSYYNDKGTSKEVLYRNIRSRVAVPLYVGKGRIEDITEAWYAMRILQALEIRGLLSHTVQSEQIQQLAEEISNTKHDRVYDYRLDLIADIRTIDAWMKENDLLIEDGGGYFTTLYDMYLYGAQVRRYSGKRWSTGISPLYFLSNTLTQNNALSQSVSAFSFIKWEQFKAINPRLQWDYYAVLLAGYGISSPAFDRIDDQTGYYTGSQLGMSLGYYPTSRISIVSRLEGVIQNSEINPQSIFFAKSNPASTLWSLYFNQQIDYYISHRTSFYFNFAVGYQNKLGTLFVRNLLRTPLPLQTASFNLVPFGRNRWFTTFNVGINHDIF